MASDSSELLEARERVNLIEKELKLSQESVQISKAEFAFQ
jgi:hypothetical protein